MITKRIFFHALFAYVLSFIIGIIIAPLLGVDFSSDVEAPPIVWFVNMAISAVIVFFVVLHYFKSEKVKNNTKEGFQFGVWMIIVGSLFDIILIVPFIFFNSAPQDPILYYSNPLLYLAYLVVIVTAMLVGYLKEQNLL
jgi:hypothetical protein